MIKLFTDWEGSHSMIQKLQNLKIYYRVFKKNVKVYHKILHSYQYKSDIQYLFILFSINVNLHSLINWSDMCKIWYFFDWSYSTKEK